MCSPLHLALTEYNEATRLANTGRQEDALAKFTKIAEDCVDEELCAKARNNAADLRRVIANNEFIKKYNHAVAQINRNERKGAVETLRELELTTEDPEKLKDVQLLLRRLGARVAKKKK